MASANTDFSPLTTRPGLFRLCFSVRLNRRLNTIILLIITLNNT